MRHEQFMKDLQMKHDWADVIEDVDTKDMVNSPPH